MYSRSAMLVMLLLWSVLPGAAQTFLTEYHLGTTGAFGPVGMATDTINGVPYLYVADPHRGAIQKINLSTGTAVALGSTGQLDGQLLRPYGVAVDPISKDLFVAERGNGRISRITNTGTFVMKWGTNTARFDGNDNNLNPPNPTAPQGTFQEPIGIAVDAAGNVYVADHGNHRVQKFHVTGTKVENAGFWGSTGSGPGQFAGSVTGRGPYGLALNSAGTEIWVADAGNSRVQRFGLNGEFIGLVGGPGLNPGQFQLPTWVTFDPAGGAVITSTSLHPGATADPDYNGQWISRFTSAGVFVSRFGGVYGQARGELALPFCAVIDASNKCYVSDYFNTRVQVFNLAAATPGAIPVIGGSNTSTATIGTAFTYQITATGTPTSYAITGTLPPGMTFDPVSGVISGTTTVVGSYPVTVWATNPTGTSAGFNLTLTTSAPRPQVYLGNIGSDPFAVIISSDVKHGLFLTRFASTGEGLVARFNLNPNGTFVTSASNVAPDSSDRLSKGATSTSAATESRTISGSITSGVVTGSIAELNRTFAANVAPATGNATALAGVYVASVPGSAFEDTYLVVAPTGATYALAVTPVGVVSGTGTITADGVVNVATSGGVSIAGKVDPSTGTVRGTLEAGATSAAIIGLNEVTTHSDRLVNLSSRLRVAGGDATRSAIAGFVVAGVEPRQVLIRAVGPSLSAFGISDPLANTKLQLYRGAILVAENEGWNNSVDVAATGDRVGAFRLADASHDSALVANLAPGAYTAMVTGAGGNGTALIEVYDAAASSPLAVPQLVNISTRGYVDGGEGSLLAGFVVTGNAPKRVLVRGIGPGLTQFGVTGAVADPMLRLYSGNESTLIAQNDNWNTPQPVAVTQLAASSAEIAAASSAAGAFPLQPGSRDAAIVVTLMPGRYTAAISGADNATGTSLVEVYEISSR